MYRRYCVAVVALVGLAATSAAAKPTPLDPGQVQSLTGQLETALDTAGCSASTAQDITVIESTIGQSGAQPGVAEAALKLVRDWSKLCASAGPAVASVDQTIALAIENTETPAAGAPIGAGVPIGGPLVFVNRDGADYVTP